ncbi:tetratricopeptide repeat protein [Nitzschia inconspicua]|uniref:Tetratricopeptide repeat protein n=1 Tax=Nitzschia inconspicua TaxID=303405 RepID=A0A9K3KT88_9STRA|nr:tetratricopeptide repeat protein [Nitzschia inconspicua]
MGHSPVRSDCQVGMHPNHQRQSRQEQRRQGHNHLFNHPVTSILSVTTTVILVLFLQIHHVTLVQSWSLPSIPTSFRETTIGARTTTTTTTTSTPSSTRLFSSIISVSESPDDVKHKRSVSVSSWDDSWTSRCLSLQNYDNDDDVGVSSTPPKRPIQVDMNKNNGYNNHPPQKQIKHNKKQQQQQQLWSMFLQGSSSSSSTKSKFRWNDPTTVLTVGNTQLQPRIRKGEKEFHYETKKNKDRGTLGFDVFEMQATRHRHTLTSPDLDEDNDSHINNHNNLHHFFQTTASSSSSSASSSSTTGDSFFAHPGVDVDGHDLIEKDENDFFSSSPGFTWSHAPLSTRSSSCTSRNGALFSTTTNPGFSSTSSSTSMAFASTTTPSSFSSPLLQQSFLLPAWFPWIPTKSQIQSLKVPELKEACSQRGLLKTGSKTVLQDRLWQWTTEQQHQHHARLTGDYLTNWFEDMARQDTTQEVPTTKRNRKTDSTSSALVNEDVASTPPLTTIKSQRQTIGSNKRYADEIMTRGSSPLGANTPNSLEEWSRTVDLDKLMNKRQEIHRQKREGKKPNSQEEPSASTSIDPKEYLSRLTNAMKASPSSPWASNKEVQELYKASKQADQLGERRLSIDLLESLLTITPNDARVYRRLARMYSEQGDVDVARATLQRGIRRMPKNPWLWHGLGQLELSNGQTDLGIECYQRAIREDPTFAHSYHAWGIYEYSQGRIASAMKILKKGVEYCPTNHRLHHALGDLYRGAKLLKDADRSYRRALREGPPVSHGFAYSALACVAYEEGNVDEARRWLYRSIQLNNGRHAQGWLALAELEEAEGNPQKALGICQASIVQYEKELIESRQRFKQQRKNDQRRIGSTESRGGSCEKRHDETNLKSDGENVLLNLSNNPEDVKNTLLKSIPPYRSGDKFLNVYRHWARLEERYGTFESANQAHERASLAFPKNYKVTLDWAQYHARIRNEDRARSLFVEACNKASKSHADPYRMFASFEMSHGNFQQARKVLFRGAQAVGNSSDGGLGNTRGLSQLFVTWAIAEWHLKNVARAETLFDHALRLTEGGKDGSELRSYILYCMALLEYQERGELYLAQHCIGLCLKENRFPEGNGVVWELWADIASDMNNHQLEEQCLVQAEKCTVPVDVASAAQDMLKASEMETWMRQDPWHDKLQAVRGMTGKDSQPKDGFYSTLRLPHREGRNNHNAFQTESRTASTIMDRVLSDQH